MSKKKVPIYIVSKGRHDTSYTSQHLTVMGIDHHVIVEEQEHDDYAAALKESRARLLVLDKKFQKEYETCDDLPADFSKGSGPARNFAWHHAIETYGADWHWTMDDNIKGFYRFNQNLKVQCESRSFFKNMEEFVQRYQNVGMAGPNYFMFATRKSGKIKPFTLNTRIYSCNLIRTDLPFRWRCRYNEDTDLSLRLLKDGWATILFNAFLQYKLPTQTVKGGNTDELYKGDGTKQGNYARTGTIEKSRALVRLHPDVASVVWKFNRWHHRVDYSGFTQPLVRKKGLRVASGVDDKGMVLRISKN